jgi:hypothetical protein
MGSFVDRDPSPLRCTDGRALDMPLNAAKLLTDMLAELGFEVKVALDGISALATAPHDPTHRRVDVRPV